jgi:hypothetical protein
MCFYIDRWEIIDTKSNFHPAEEYIKIGGRAPTKIGAMVTIHGVGGGALLIRIHKVKKPYLFTAMAGPEGAAEISQGLAQRNPWIQPSPTRPRPEGALEFRGRLPGALPGRMF